MYLLIWVIVIEKKCFIDMTYDTGHWFIASKWQHLYIYYFPIPDPFFTFPWDFRKSYQTNFFIQILLVYADPHFAWSRFYADPHSPRSTSCTIHILCNQHSLQSTFFRINILWDPLLDPHPARSTFSAINILCNPHSLGSTFLGFTFCWIQILLDPNSAWSKLCMRCRVFLNMGKF